MPSLRGAHGRLLRSTGALHPEVLVFDLTHRCNSRCAGCGFREPEPGELPADRWRTLAIEGAAAGFAEVVVTGGEPLAHPDIAPILDGVAAALPVSLNTNGLLLSTRADLVRRTVRRLYVSFDGATEDTYARVRGLRGLGAVCRGVAAAEGLYTHARVTVWRENVDELEAIVELAAKTGFTAVSFLAPDTTSAGFGPRDPAAAQPPEPADIPRVEAAFARLRRHPLLEMSDTAMARVLGLLRGERVAPRCLAPWTSAVIAPDGRIDPCFFLRGEQHVQDGLAAGLRAGRGARRALDPVHNPTCQRCVCWRG